MVFRSLTNCSFEEISEAFCAAFAEYEIQLTPLQLKVMIERRGYVAELSFGAFENDRLVAFTLNGIGDYKGIKTAYDTGTGTLKEFRGQGLAGQVFEYSLPFLKEAGVEQYLLEVLQHNTAAVSVYKKQGFKIQRSFHYFSEAKDKIGLEAKTKEKVRVERLDQIDKAVGAQWWDFYPSWQNSFEAVERRSSDFVILGAFSNDRWVGYCIFEPHSGDITQLAVDPGFRRLGIGTALLHEAISYSQFPQLKLINTDTQFENIRYFAEKTGIKLQGQQYEMILRL